MIIVTNMSLNGYVVLISTVTTLPGRLHQLRVRSTSSVKILRTFGQSGLGTKRSKIDINQRRLVRGGDECIGDKLGIALRVINGAAPVRTV